MQRSITKTLVKHSFWISLLLHLLFLLCAVLVISNKPKEDEKKQPNIYEVPSYIYKGAITPKYQPNKTTTAQTSKKVAQPRTVKLPSPKVSHNEQKVQEVKKAPVVIPRKEEPHPPSLMASSLQMLQATQLQRIASHHKVEEPILMIGDQHEVADPFITLIGRALSANFRYPDLEGRMGIKGRVIIEMTLHPEGNFDEVEIVQSSNNQHLDAAALYAVNQAPLVEQASRFIQKPKRIAVGFVFLTN